MTYTGGKTSGNEHSADADLQAPRRTSRSSQAEAAPRCGHLAVPQQPTDERDDGTAGNAPCVVFVGLKARHCFSNVARQRVVLVEGQGVRGDVHFCPQPDFRNQRQVHLLQSELLEQLRDAGFAVGPGDLGENITTRGLPLPDLPHGTRLVLPSGAVLKLVGLRNPCSQLERFQKGLAKAVMARTPTGRKTSRAGVLATVLASGVARPGQPIEVKLPRRPHRPLPGI